MRLAVVARYVGLALLLNAIFLCISAGVSFIYHDAAFTPLLLSAVTTFIVGIFPFIFVPPEIAINTREGYLIVVLGWCVSCLFGMLPYILYGDAFSVSNAWFESVSGYTTTGASILKDIEALPHGLLFWRSATHWIGGVGVVVFTLLVLPSVGSAKLRLSRTQASVKHEDANYNTQKIVRVILGVYMGLTVTLAALLWVAGMSLFDAVNHAFSTVATGGFSTRNASIMHYNSPLIEAILMVFMVISSINFGLLYVSIIKRFTPLFNSPVVRYFVSSVAVGILLTTVSLINSGNYSSWLQAFREAAFQVTSIASTTGFAIGSNATWPTFAVALSFFFMLQCGCAGSTSGGVKADRVLIFYKAFVANIRKMLHPNAIVSVRLKGISMDESVVSSASLFIVLYMLIAFIVMLLILLTGLDLMTSFSAAVASLGNVGPGYGEIYSLGNYSEFSVFAKIVCTIAMLVGRLEIYGVLMLFYYRYWR
ncbi:MAG: TrkH family potassium uptake protein [Prevotellaceae bacterium]|jgi:trk system potassium uptake protein TrkH|nr:TrkH family potassium uptake protein [Prevotellaceae bacterium]